MTQRSFLSVDSIWSFFLHSCRKNDDGRWSRNKWDGFCERRGLPWSVVFFFTRLGNRSSKKHKEVHFLVWQVVKWLVECVINPFLGVTAAAVCEAGWKTKRSKCVLRGESIKREMPALGKNFEMERVTHRAHVVTPHPRVTFLARVLSKSFWAVSDVIIGRVLRVPQGTKKEKKPPRRCVIVTLSFSFFSSERIITRRNHLSFLEITKLIVIILGNSDHYCEEWIEKEIHDSFSLSFLQFFNFSFFFFLSRVFGPPLIHNYDSNVTYFDNTIFDFDMLSNSIVFLSFSRSISIFIFSTQPSELIFFLLSFFLCLLSFLSFSGMDVVGAKKADDPSATGKSHLTGATTSSAAAAAAGGHHAGNSKHKLLRSGQVTLPDETRQKLGELRRDFLNDELTEKGYMIRKGKILGIYAPDSAFCHISDSKSNELVTFCFGIWQFFFLLASWQRNRWPTNPLIFFLLFLFLSPQNFCWRLWRWWTTLRGHTWSWHSWREMSSRY